MRMRLFINFQVGGVPLIRKQRLLNCFLERSGAWSIIYGSVFNCGGTKSHVVLFFSTWGETSFMSVQTSILIILCYYYNGNVSGIVAFPVIYPVFVYVLTCGVVPIDVHTKMQIGILPIISFSKVSKCTNFIR